MGLTLGTEKLDSSLHSYDVSETSSILSIQWATTAEDYERNSTYYDVIATYPVYHP